jgi:hypothetical protein
MKSLFVMIAALMSMNALADGGKIVLYGGRANGYDTVECPRGYFMMRCATDERTCDNASQDEYSCSADSRNHRQCNITVVCREDRFRRR